MPAVIAGTKVPAGLFRCLGSDGRQPGRSRKTLRGWRQGSLFEDSVVVSRRPGIRFRVVALLMTGTVKRQARR